LINPRGEFDYENRYFQCHEYIKKLHGCDNASNAFMLTVRQAVYNLGERYFITNHEWENSNHCCHTLEGSHDKKIVPQYGQITTDSGQQVLVEAWRTEKFFPLRIRNLLAWYITESRQLINPASSQNLQRIRGECLFTIQTYWITWLTINLAILRNNPLTNSHTPILFGFLTDRVMEQLAALTDGRSYCLAIGLPSHACYLNVIRHGNECYFRIDNFGSGSEYHNHQQQAGLTVPIISTDPFILTRRYASSLANDSAVKKYVRTLLEQYCITQVLPAMQPFLTAQLYDRTVQPTFSHKHTNPPPNITWPAGRTQTAGNCAVYNYQYGMQLRCGNPFVQELMQQELAFLGRRKTLRSLRVPMNAILLNRYYQSFPNLPELLQHEYLADLEKQSAELQCMDGTTVPLANCYTPLTVKPTSAHPTSSSVDRPSEPTTLALFESFFAQQHSQRIWFIGRAGSGKSTLCQYLVWTFATRHIWQERFELVINLPLRKLWLDPSQHYQHMSEFLAKTCFHRPLYPFEEQALSAALHHHRILLLLDGADEFSLQTLPPHRQAIYEALLAYPCHILTTRPYAIPNVTPDQYYSLLGFELPQAQQYVAQRSQIDPQAQAQTLALLPEKLARDPTLQLLARSPLLLELLYDVWKMQPSMNAILSLGQLFHAIIDSLLRQRLEKSNMRIDPNSNIF
jgi:hypothetical protein